MSIKEILDKVFAAVYDRFLADFQCTNRHTQSFAQRMWNIMESEKVTYIGPQGKQIKSLIRDKNHFAEVTGLGTSTYERIKFAAKSDDNNYVPSLKTFLTLCMVYQLNITVVRELRRSYGYDFVPNNRIHQAYIYLLVNCRGKSLSYCNRVLKALKIDRKYYLGDGTIDQDTIIQELPADA